MPVLIPLALNTGFYIQYLIKSFSKITNKKETIPVYFNFGLIAAIGVSFPVILYFILKKDIQLYLYNYISTSVVLLVIGVLMFKYLVAKNLKNVSYFTTFETMQKQQNKNWKTKLHDIIYEADTPTGKLFDVVLLITIIASILLVMLESVKSIDAKYHTILNVFCGSSM